MSADQLGREGLGLVWPTTNIDVDGSTAAVLGIPPAVVSAFLVTTDSPLVARFLFVPRLLLVLSNVALWCLLLWKLSL